MNQHIENIITEIDVTNPPKRKIAIGHQGENKFRKVIFDVSKWHEYYPSGETSIVIKRPDGEVYPVVVGVAEDKVEYSPSNTDTSVVGDGWIEVRMSDNGVVGKSCRMPVLIAASIVGEGDEPDAPVADWITQIIDGISDAIKDSGLSFDGGEFVKIDDDGNESDNYYLHLQKSGQDVDNFVPIYVPPDMGGAGGGGGSGGSTYSFKFKNISGANSFTVAKGGTVKLRVSYSSVDDGDPLSGSIEIYVNGIKKDTIGVDQQTTAAVEKEIDISKHLPSGNSTVRLRASDGMSSKSLTFTVNVVDIRISSIFDDNDVYSGDINVRYTTYGSVDKTVYFILDDNYNSPIAVAQLTADTTGKQMEQTIPASAFSHGSHTLRIYAEASLGGGVLRSNVLSYGIVYNAGLDAIIVASGFNQTEANEGEIISIPYYVFDKNNPEPDVVLTVQNPDGTNYSSITLENVERKKQVWAVRKYPAGEGIRFIISCGTGANKGEKVFTLNITPSESSVDVLTNMLLLRLNAIGKENGSADRDQWVNEVNNTNVATMTDFNYTTNGWNKDDGALEVSGSASASLNLELFKSDMATNGRTFEIEFKTESVKNTDTTIMSCSVPGRNAGVVVTPHELTFSGNNTSISVKYGENDRLRIGVVVEPRPKDEDTLIEGQSRLIHVYVNGVHSGCVQYPQDDQFWLSANAPFVIGSEECTIKVYSVLIYDRALTRYEMLENYIAERPTTTPEEIAARDALVLNNNIYRDGEEKRVDNIDISKLNSQIPCMTLIGTLPTRKGDKQFLDVEYTDLANDRYFYWADALVDVQGTSSQYYPRKNYKIKSVKGKKDYGGNVGTTVVVDASDGEDAEGVEKPKFCLNPEYIIPVTDFCIKADFAESSGTHNTGLAKLIPALYTDKTPPQQDNPDKPIRTTVYGYPIAVFHKETADSTPVFLGKYNFNSDKGADKSFGFDKEAYPAAECWEILNNYSMRNVWLAKVDSNYEGTGAGGTLKPIANDFERRFPDQDDEDYPLSYDNIKALASWLASTAVETGYNPDFEEDISKPTGDELPAGGNNYGYTHDTREYRLAKFRAEFTQHFNLDYCLIYYICAEFFAMADSRAKNMMLATWDGSKWYPIFYDMDTVLGINNQGKIAYKYNVEFDDTVLSQDVFNGRLSVLWNNFGRCFQDEIKAKYNEIRARGGIFNMNVFNEYFETQQADCWNESVYNEDGNTKYVEPAIHGLSYTDPDDTSRTIKASAFLYALQGDRDSHRYWWLSNRLPYMDSKYLNGSIANDYITFRASTPRSYSGVAPSATMEITPYADMYCYIRVTANGVPQGKRGWQNEVCVIEPNADINNVEVAVFGASMIADIGDLSSKYCSELDTSNAIRLSKLIVGSHKNGYHNDNLTQLTVGENKLLREINIENCPNFKQSLDIHKCDNIQRVYAKGSGVTSVRLPEAGYLTDLELPGTITSLSILKQRYITNFQIETADRLNSIRIEDCVGVPEAGLVSYIPNLDVVRLIHVDWTATGNGALDNSKALRRLLEIEHFYDANNNQGSDATTRAEAVTGTVYCKTKSTDNLASLLSASFPNLNVTFGAANEYKVTFKVTEADGTVRTVAEEYVAQGDAVVDPTERDICPIVVTKADADGYSYVFNGWDKDFSNVTANMTVNATFTQTAAMSTVIWNDPYASTEANKEKHGNAVLGSKAVPLLYPDNTVIRDDVEYVFCGWQNKMDDTKAIDDYEVTDAITTFEAQYEPVALPSDFDTMVTMYSSDALLEKLTWPQIRALCKSESVSVETVGTGAEATVWLQYKGNNILKLHDVKSTTTSNGYVIKWEIAGFNQGGAQQEDDRLITWAMKYAYGGTSIAMNSSGRMMFKYSIGGKTYEAYKDDYVSSTNTYTHSGSSEYVTMQFLDYSSLTSIKVTYSDSTAKTWYWNTTVTDTSDAANEKYGAITASADDPDGFRANKNRTGEFSFHGMLCSAVDGDIMMNFNNDGNTSSATGHAEFHPGSYIKIPVDNGATVTITHTVAINNGGYYYSTYRSWVNNTFIPLFPRAFRNSLKIPTNNVNLGMYSKTLVPFHDVLYPFSSYEMGSSSQYNYMIKQGYGALKIYSNNDSRIKKKAAKDGEPASGAAAQYVWLRTAHVGYYNNFWIVYASGAFNGNIGNGSCAVLLGCIT